LPISTELLLQLHCQSNLSSLPHPSLSPSPSPSFLDVLCRYRVHVQLRLQCKDIALLVLSEASPAWLESPSCLLDDKLAWQHYGNTDHAQKPPSATGSRLLQARRRSREGTPTC
jgi:hypothetical protein